MRELIQNAADAIRARRDLQPGFRGRVLVTVDDDLTTLTVGDDGVGMAEGQLTGVLLDFGRSLWESPELAAVLPGLAAEVVGAVPACEFVLTHTTHAYDRQGWEQHHYNVIAHGRVGTAFADRHQPGQVIVITGELDLQLADTLVGPLPYITIIAHHIVAVDGPLNPAASAAAPDSDTELYQTPVGPVPHTRNGQ